MLKAQRTCFSDPTPIVFFQIIHNYSSSNEYNT